MESKLSGGLRLAAAIAAFGAAGAKAETSMVVVSPATPANVASVEVVYTNVVQTAPFVAASNAQIKITYKAEDGFYFADGATNLTATFDAAANPTLGPTNGMDVAAYAPHVCDGLAFTKRITDTDSLQAFLQTDGNGYLANDVTLTDNVSQPHGDAHVTNNLCLNGMTLNANGKGVSVFGGGALTIHDCGTTTNYFKTGMPWTKTDKANADTNLVGGVVIGGEDDGFGYPLLYAGYHTDDVYDENVDYGMLAIKGGNYVGNRGNDMGGLISISQGTLVIDGGTFAGNYCDGKGGVAYAIDSSVVFDGGTFADNRGILSGVLYGVDSEVTVNGGKFADNQTLTIGGAFVIISDQNESSLTVNGGKFIGNYSVRGGAICAEASSILSVNGGEFIGNYSVRGGAICAEASSILSVNGGLFISNKADGYGGAIFSCSSQFLIDGGVFDGNLAQFGSAVNNEKDAMMTVRGDVVITGGGNSETIFNYGKMVWDLTDGGAPRIDTSKNVANGPDGTLKISFDETLTNGCHEILRFADGSRLTGSSTVFAISNGVVEKACAPAAPDAAEWIYFGEKRVKLVSENNSIALVVASPVELDFAKEVDGGSFTVSTNDVAIGARTGVYSDSEVALSFSPADGNWIVDTNSLMVVDANGVTNDISHFADVSLSGATFKMPATNATLFVAFTVSGEYRDKLIAEADEHYRVVDAELEKLRGNRLEHFEAIDYEMQAFMWAGTAENKIKAAYTPKECDDALTAMTNAISKIYAEAKAVSDGKPWTITVDADAAADGTNVFNSIAAARASRFTPFATNVVVVGEQRLTNAWPQMSFGWNLIVTNWHAAAAPHDASKSPFRQTRFVVDAGALTASFTNKLVTVGGEGRILLANENDEEGTEALAQSLRGRVAGAPSEAKVQIIAAPHSLRTARQDDGAGNIIGYLDGEYVAIDNVILSHDVITNWTALSAPAATNVNLMGWDLRNDNHDAFLASFDDVVQSDNGYARRRIVVDEAQTLGGVATNYVIAGRANTADGMAFNVYTDLFDDESTLTNLVVGGEAVYVGAKAYALYLVAGESDAAQSNLVFEISHGKVAVTYNASGGKWDGVGECTNADAYFNRGYELPANPVRNGYVFDGWHRSWTNGAELVTTTSAVAPMRPHVLFAHWSPAPNGDDKTIALSEFVDGSPRTQISKNDGFYGNRTVERICLPLYVTRIGESAFRSATHLKAIEFVRPRDYATFAPTTLVIEATAFYGATRLETVTLPPYVSSIGKWAFAQCTSLTNVTVLGDLAGATLGDRPFVNCGRNAGGITIRLSPKAAANAALVHSITNGSTARVVVDAALAGEVHPNKYVDFTVGDDIIRFKLSAQDLPSGTPVTAETVSALFATYPTGLSDGVALAPKSVTEESPGVYVIEFDRPQTSNGFLRLSVINQK